MIDDIKPTSGGAGKANDLDELRKAVVDAAGVSTRLWLSYLFVFFYLAIAAGGVTHRDLFFENPVKLPFLIVDLPLLGFFVLGPLLFVVVHAYVLLHFVLLADKVGALAAELASTIDDEGARVRFRRRLPSNIFVQILAGPRDARMGVIGFMLRLIARISIVVGPIALLVFFQLQFLPYHHAPITWWHRFALLIDLILLWILWPSIARGKITWLWRYLRRSRVRRRAGPAIVATLAPILLAFAIATFPGESWDEHLPSVPLIPTKWPAWQSAPHQIQQKAHLAKSQERIGIVKNLANSWSQVAGSVASMGWTSLHELLVAGDVDFVANKPTSLWSNRLVLPTLDAIDRTKFDTEAKISASEETLSLRGRRLEGAVLISAQLRKANFTGAWLQGAWLSGADLRGARFGCARERLGSTLEPSKRCTQLQAANFDDAKLRGAWFYRAQLEGASLRAADLQSAQLDYADLRNTDLREAKLQGASLEDADLRGSSLMSAHLAGARLKGARLHGAFLYGASLDGANLDGAQLLGASLTNARLRGATLWSANLQGAWLDSAELYGADLGRSNLQGATLRNTYLQGANLSETDLRGAFMSNNLVWRSDPRDAKTKGARIIGPNFTSQKHCPPLPAGSSCDWSAKSLAVLKKIIEETIPDGDVRDKALQRIAVLDPAKHVEGEDGMSSPWDALAGSSASSAIFQENLASRLRAVGCDAEGAPAVIEGFLRDLSHFSDRFDSGSPYPAALAACFLDEAQCPGGRGVSEDSKRLLRGIRDEFSPVQKCMAPKP